MPHHHPLTLMFVCAGKSGGGAELNFLRSCQNFHRIGSATATVIPVVRKKSWLEKRLQEEQIPFHTASFGGLFDFTTKRFMKRLIQKTQPHVVQCWMNRAASMTPKLPGVVLIGRLGGYYKLKNYRYMDHFVANVRGIVAHIQAGGYPADAVTLVPNFAGFPADDFATARDGLRRAYGLSDDAVVLLSSSRLHPHKGQDTILRAMVQMPSRVHCFMAGNGPDEAMLKTLAQSLNLQDRVHFTGWVDNMSSLCAASDIFVVSSRIEPMGNVILAAWTHHLPLISSNATGPAEVVEDGVTGLMYPIDDHAALAAQVQRLLNDPTLAKKLADAGHEHVRTEYADDVIIQKYLNMYHYLLAQQQGTAL